MMPHRILACLAIITSQHSVRTSFVIDVDVKDLQEKSNDRPIIGSKANNFLKYF